MQIKRDTPVTVYDLAAKVSFDTNVGTPTAAAWSPNGKYLAIAHSAAGESASTVTLYSFKSNTLTAVKAYNDGVGENFVASLQYTDDGSEIFYGTYEGTVGLFDVPAPLYIAPALSAVAVSPATNHGNATAAGKVTLTGQASPVGPPLYVTLSSSDTTVATAPASVLVPICSTTATFPVTTFSQAANKQATITATYAGITKSTVITVGPPAPITHKLLATSIVGGNSNIGTVTMSGPVFVDTLVTLSTSATGFNLPEGVTVPAGQSSATYTFTPSPVTATVTGKIYASANGVSVPVNLTVVPPSLLGILITINPVKGGNPDAGSVAMSGLVAVDTTVTLTNANPNAILASSTITIQAGSTVGAFLMTTTATTKVVSGAIKATVGSVTKSVTLKVMP